jgi:hypothetical protein
MENVSFIDVQLVDGTTQTFAITENQSMLKADYEASTLPSNSSTPQAGA